MKKCFNVLCLSMFTIIAMCGTLYAQSLPAEETMLIVVTELIEPVESMAAVILALDHDLSTYENAGTELETVAALPEPEFSAPVDLAMGGAPEMVTCAPELSASRPELSEVLDVQTPDSSEVPEPGTLALVLFGLLGMAGIARKKHLF